MISIVAAYALIAFFLVFEGRIRQGQAAKRLDRGQADRGSTLLVGASFGIASLAPAVGAALDYWRIAFVDYTWIGWCGVAIMVAGLALRFWANRTLGEFYTRTLVTTAGQRVVQAGPYRVVRHPGYLGSLLFWLGAGVAAMNWIAALLVVVLMFGVYVYRIQSEEVMLKSALGQEYLNYSARTWRLIPLIY
ncbi:MAG: isoprenylcysteine carboxylmethyltransferase family protein [Chloroflexi bacterium]|nr:isoprenylcysteine carboxylmethyltransferase family protein [Chloroflexota bacterium]